MSFNQPSFLTKQNTLPKKDGKFENNEWAKEKNPQLVEIVRKLISDVSVLKNTTTQQSSELAESLGFDIDITEVPEKNWTLIGRKQIIGPDNKPYHFNLIIDEGEPKIFIADPGEDNKLGNGETFFFSESDIV